VTDGLAVRLTAGWWALDLGAAVVLVRADNDNAAGQAGQLKPRNGSLRDRLTESQQGKLP